jgi:hypothetical protein
VTHDAPSSDAPPPTEPTAPSVPPPPTPLVWRPPKLAETARAMPNNRGLAFRLLALSALFFWAIAKIGPGVDAPDGRHTLPPPNTWTRPVAEGASPPVVDVLAAVELLDTLSRRAAACPATGVLRVELGPEGLVRAELEGSGEILCVARLLWEAPWPRGVQQVELAQDIVRPAAPAAP